MGCPRSPRTKSAKRRVLVAELASVFRIRRPVPPDSPFSPRSRASRDWNRYGGSAGHEPGKGGRRRLVLHGRGAAILVRGGSCDVLAHQERGLAASGSS